MKRSLISGCLVAVVAMLLSGCVGVLQTQWVPVRVGFDPVIGHDTRAEESVPFPAERTFNVWAVSAAGGELYIDGKLVNDVVPKDRDIAMVFQNYALYPHMTVRKNIAFPLENLRTEEVVVVVSTAVHIFGAF